MKSPHHAVPSGDRRIARLFLRSLTDAGHAVDLASEFRAHSSGPETQNEHRHGATLEAERLIAAYRSGAAPSPELWFSYHVYYKAPDWIGPAVSDALNIPYVIAEASFAPKRAGGPWQLGHGATERAIRRADGVISPTRLDMACVAPLVDSGTVHEFLPPFLDHAPFAAAAAARSMHRAGLAHQLALPDPEPWLLVVAMMRPGAKLESYRVLARALRRLTDQAWRLVVVGDGPAAAAVRADFAAFGNRVRWAGERAPEDLAGTYAACDVYVWPAIHEAYGMAILEAQAAGLAAVLGDVRGVPDVVERDRTALLVPEGDDAAFAAALRGLLMAPDHRQVMASAARDLVARERTLARATRALARILDGATLAHRRRRAA
jgi:glycosyltransferase involved in cell wall biosynthesis